jgi:hypothetical protein
MHIVAVLHDVFLLELQCIIYQRPMLSGGLRVVSTMYCWWLSSEALRGLARDLDRFCGNLVNVGRLETWPLTALGGPTSPKHGSPKPATGLDRVTVS